MTRLTFAAACLTLLALAGCGSSSSDPSTVSAPQDSPAVTPPSDPAAAAPAAVGPCTATATKTDLAKKPVVVPPSTPAPAKTTTIDLVCGTGAEAKTGSAVKVKYVGVLYKGGTEFDASWKTSSTYTYDFTTGTGGAIAGFDSGVIGMKVGGRREILIPSADGYGAQGSPPTIPAGADLVFVIDLVSAS